MAIDDLESILKESRPAPVASARHKERLEISLRERMMSDDVEILSLKTYALILAGSLMLCAGVFLLEPVTRTDSPPTAVYERWSPPEDMPYIKLPRVKGIVEPRVKRPPKRRLSSTHLRREEIVAHLKERQETLGSIADNVRDRSND